MFTATTTNKDFRGGIFQVTVDFTDGTETITEAFNITSEDDMNRRIEARLASLNDLATLRESLVLGKWVKPEKEEPVVVPQTPLQIAEAELYRLKNLIGLGVMKESDPEFVAAVTSYKTASSSK